MGVVTSGGRAGKAGMADGAARRRRWRRVIIGGVAAAAAAVLLALDTAVWWVVTAQMMDAVPGAIAAAAQEGWRIEAGEVRRGGWPVRATVRLVGTAATRDLGSVQVRWTADEVDLVLGLRAPTVLAVVPRGRQTLAVGPGPGTAIQAASMAVLVPLNGAGPVTARAAGLVLRAPDGRGLAVDRLELQLEPAALAGTAEGVLATPGMAAPFDGPARLALRVLNNRPFPDATDPAASALAWQRAGGRLEVPEFSLRLASVAIEGSGAGGLDADLQPQGQATLRVQGAGAMLDAAARAGLLAAGPAGAARAVLDLLAGAARGGPVTVPVSLQDRVLTVLRFPLVRLPALDWSAKDRGARP